jgi:hypothetical protein
MVFGVSAVMAIHKNDDGAPNVITYLFTDNHGNRIEELPLTGVTFSLVLNASGQWSGTLNIEDPRVQQLNWRGATAPNLAQMWIDIDGTLVYGGRVLKRTYTKTTGAITISGSDHYSYLSQRLQAGDYATTWATVPAGAAQIAHQLVADALGDAGSLQFGLTTPHATPAQYGITLSSPRSQRMSVDALVSMISTLGWNVGLDFAMDYAYVAGVPVATLTLSYPRRGRVAGTTGLMIDTAEATEFTYDEDGTQQAMSVAQLATGSGGLSTVGVYEPAISVDGYPLLERVAMHSMFSAAATPKTVLNAFAADDLALTSYPVTVPQITLPTFAEPAIGEWIVGDDVRILVPVSAGSIAVMSGGVYPSSGLLPSPGFFPAHSTTTTSTTTMPPVDPRFPQGMDFYWRITKADISLPAEGVPTTVYSFNVPPSSSPQRPPT